MKGQSRASSFTKHWLRIRIDGFKPEELLTQALAEGAAIRNIVLKDETELYCSVAASDYKLLKKLAKSRYRLTITEEGGALPAIRAFRMNKLLLAGLALFILFFLAQTLFIREIRIIGCETITEDEIRSVLREEGLYEGCFNRIQYDQIEKRLFAEYDHIVWANVAGQGTYVQVEIAEGEPQEEEIRNREKPCHIVAEKDCYIEKIYTYKGRAHVREGDFVGKGGILISGIVPIEHPTYPLEEDVEPVHYVHAEGKIKAKVPYYFSFYTEAGSTEQEMEAALRQWVKKNIPENAEILNKDFQFQQKKNIIKVYGIIETRQQVGIEKEIVIDKRQESRDEENTD